MIMLPNCQKTYIAQKKPYRNRCGFFLPWQPEKISAKGLYRFDTVLLLCQEGKQTWTN